MLSPCSLTSEDDHHPNYGWFLIHLDEKHVKPWIYGLDLNLGFKPHEPIKYLSLAGRFGVIMGTIFIIIITSIRNVFHELHSNAFGRCYFYYYTNYHYSMLGMLFHEHVNMSVNRWAWAREQDRIFFRENFRCLHNI